MSIYCYAYNQNCADSNAVQLQVCIGVHGSGLTEMKKNKVEPRKFMCITPTDAQTMARTLPVRVSP